tara:strand:+ start:634 stop:1500 length:867 start_codon:yes stop_codon:yes gene_type:complete
MAEIRTLKKLPAGLYIVATPIGNLGDITRRAKDTLAAADLVACEDTRITGKLLNAYLIKKPMLPYHEHNAAGQRPKILTKIAEGGVVVLVSDAGTPLISDPGYKLVDEAHKMGLMVTSLPGPSAVPTALSVAGLPTNRFLFMGFSPTKTKARHDWFAAEKETEATLVYYESAKRLAASLRDAASALGPRPAAVCRELTKKFEQVVRNDLVSLAAHYEKAETPKGEIVVVIGSAPKSEKREGTSIYTDETLQLALNHMSVKSAAAFVAELTGEKRKGLYARALELSEKN